jgi:hypothetical protein
VRSEEIGPRNRGHIITDYNLPAEMSGTGEVVGGQVHIHATMAGQISR